MVVIFCRCNSDVHGQNKAQVSSDKQASDYRKVLQEREAAASEKNNDNLGQLISKIDFNVKSYDSVNRKDVITTMVELSKPDVINLMQKEVIVIKEHNVTLIIDYPLNKPCIIELSSDNGFSRENLVKVIAKKYKEIYNEEENTASIKTVPPSERTGMYNRNETNGKYGIWGHDISDLVLTSVWVYRKENGQLVLSLQIDS